MQEPGSGRVAGLRTGPGEVQAAGGFGALMTGLHFLPSFPPSRVRVGRVGEQSADPRGPQQQPERPGRGPGGRCPFDPGSFPASLSQQCDLAPSAAGGSRSGPIPAPVQGFFGFWLHCEGRCAPQAELVAGEGAGSGGHALGGPWQGRRPPPGWGGFSLLSSPRAVRCLCGWGLRGKAGPSLHGRSSHCLPNTPRLCRWKCRECLAGLHRRSRLGALLCAPTPVVLPRVTLLAWHGPEAGSGLPPPPLLFLLFHKPSLQPSRIGV